MERGGLCARDAPQSSKPAVGNQTGDLLDMPASAWRRWPSSEMAASKLRSANEAALFNLFYFINLISEVQKFFFLSHPGARPGIVF